MKYNRRFATGLSILFVFIIIISFIYLISCTPQKKPAKEPEKQEEKEEVPSEIKELKKNVEKIEKTLDSIHKDKEQLNPEEKKEDNNNESEESNKGNSEEESSKKEKEQNEQKEKLQIQLRPEELSEYEEQLKKIEEQKKKEKKNEDVLKKFDSLKDEVAELHSLWNSAEPKLIKSLASQSSIKNFEKALNILTNTILEPDEYVNLLSLIELYRYLPDFYELYKTKEPADLDRLRYGIKKIILVSEKDDYENEIASFDYLQNIWSKAKPKFDEDLISTINRFDLALTDLKASIDNKNKIIIKAKAQVLIKIIDEISEKSAS